MSRKIVFQAWLWKLKNIPVEEVARQGFTAIQTSPLQPLKEKIKLTKELKGKIEILDNCIMVSRNVKKGIDKYE